jgi:hypothetical protein
MAHNPGLKNWIILALLLASLGVGFAEDAGHPSEKDGRLVVPVSWDDAYKTPATGVYIEAHSFNVNGVLEKSFILKMVKAGRYESAIPPGVYDVFVSEASSTPRCKRMSTERGYIPYWNLMLEHDNVYLQR